MYAEGPALFRNYESLQFVLPDCYIWQACLATTAAPTFFPPTNIHGRYYVEGGLGNNNPVRTCIDEALRIWGKKRLLGCVVSIGTGKAQMNDVARGFYLLKTLRDIATSPDKAALEFRNEMLGNDL
jgi:predicted acylesterase/phospholipase RssA